MSKDNLMIKRFLMYFLLFIAVCVHSQDWSKLQLGTGIGNCGPAAAAMLVERSGQHITVQEARMIIGYRQVDGATSFGDLKTILRRYNVSFSLIRLSDYREGAMIVLLEISRISNKLHYYNGRHYVVIFGIKDGYYRIYDPLVRSEQLYLIEEVQRAQTGEIIWTM